MAADVTDWKDGDLAMLADDGSIDSHSQMMMKWKMRKNIHHKALFKELQVLVKNESLEGGSFAREQLSKMCVTELHEAVIRNNYDEVQRILKLSTSTVNDLTWFGETALYFASYIGSLPLVLLLLHSGATVTSADSAEESELLAAVRTDQTSIAKMLIANGSNVDILCDDWTPLHVACFTKSPHMIRVLIDSGANVNVVGEWTYAPINMIFVEYSEAIKLLYECQDEWLIKRALEALLTSSKVDLNYWSRCALGNPQVITRALTLLSPTICRLLVNYGASADILFDYSKRAIHDELVVAFSIYGSKIGFGIVDRVQRYTACLQLLINHGIEPSDADLKTTARLLLQQLKLVPLSVKYPHLEPTFSMLIDFCRPSKGPVDLTALCRRAVRRAVGHPVAPRLNSIDFIAPRLKSYILMEEIGLTELYSR